MAQHRRISQEQRAQGVQPNPVSRPTASWAGRRPALLPALVGVVVVALLAATVLFTRPATVAASCAAAGATTGLAVGQCAPDFTLDDAQGRRVSLAGTRGHPLLIHFWAVGCTTCRAEYPDFSRAVAAYEPKGLRVLAVDAWGESAPLVRQWRTSHHLQATFLIDEPQAVVRQYGVQGTPTTLFVDRQGRITGSHTGPLGYADFQSALAGIV